VADKVSEIRNDFQQKMASAEDTEKAQSLQEEASAEMVEAVQASGMSVEEFNQIAYALQSDPALQERLAAIQS
jgi:GTP1/Obg family GTP-binding protein